MSATKIQLKRLVDLAVCNREIGAVNFNHLRALLLAILKSTNIEDVLTDTCDLHAADKKNDTKAVADDANDSATEDNMSRLLTNQKSHDERLSVLEKELHQTSNYPLNSELLEERHELLDERNKKADGTSTGGEAPGNDMSSMDRLTFVWHNKKLVNRLQVAEEAIDKLFSLMNDVLSQTDKTSKEGDTIDELQNELTKLKNVLEHCRNGIDENQNKIKTLNEQTSNIYNDVNNNSSLQNNNNASIDELNKRLSEYDEKLKEFQFSARPKEKHDTHIEKLDLAEEGKNNDKNIFDEIKEIKKLLDGKADHRSLRDSQNTLNKLKQLLDERADCSNVEGLEGALQQQSDLASRMDLNERLKKIEEELPNKANQSSLDEMTSNFIMNRESLSEEIEKIKQSISNMDDQEIAKIMQNIEELKKMADEIDELRKLSDLKDLADNVEDLKSIKNTIDDLQNDFEQNRHKSKENGEELKGILEKLNEYENEKKELNNSVQNIENSLTDIFNDIAKSKNDLARFEKLLKAYLESREGKEKLLKAYLESGEGKENYIQDGTDIDNEKEFYTNNVDVGSIMSQIVHHENQLSQLESLINSLKTNQDQIVKSMKLSETAPSAPAFDTSVLAAIQHLAQQNRQHIAAVQADLNILRKIQVPATSSNEIRETNISESSIENLRSHLDTLQEEQVRLSGHLSNMVDDTKDEFNRKQKHIDALYEYIDKLQHNKADKNDINSEMDVKADKKALDGKVSMSMFDERYQLLEHALQDALSRLDQYVDQEANLRDALHKLNEDMDSKMDSDAEKKLKKFMENRLQEIQDSRTNLPNEEFDLRNAAGLRKPMPLSYHCISCDRPIDVTMRGVLPPVPHNFPSKKSMGPYTTFELDQIRQSKKTSQPVYDKVNTMLRPCGGQHTTVNASMYRGQKLSAAQSDANDVPDNMSAGSEDMSIIDCVVGKDGQLYRGRFKQNNLPPPIPKKIPCHNGRNMRHKHRVAHSATVNNKKPPLTPPKDVDRPYSASFFENQTTSNGGSVILPPISGDEILVNTRE